jgi:hypothetical protein
LRVVFHSRNQSIKEFGTFEITRLCRLMRGVDHLNSAMPGAHSPKNGAHISAHQEASRQKSSFGIRRNNFRSQPRRMLRHWRRLLPGKSMLLKQTKSDNFRATGMTKIVTKCNLLVKK